MTASITDFSQFSALRHDTQNNDPEVLREVAGQFEALFVQSILKNMRDSELADPLFGQSDQHDMYQDMMDKQLSLEMSSGRGIGLAEMLVRQLGGNANYTPSELPTSNDAPIAKLESTSEQLPKAGPVNSSPPPINETAKLQVVSEVAKESPAWTSAKEFVMEIWPHAEKVAGELGVRTEAVIAQAALETGWGAHVALRADGRSSNNLFGIKTGSAWRGDSVSKSTVEVSAGVAKKEIAQFRSYDSLAATFDDYFQFLSSNQRYDSVKNKGNDVSGFAHALQSSNYATDPNYAQKITAVFNSPTMRDAVAEYREAAKQPSHLQL